MRSIWFGLMLSLAACTGGSADKDTPPDPPVPDDTDVADSDDDTDPDTDGDTDFSFETGWGNETGLPETGSPVDTDDTFQGGPGPIPGDSSTTDSAICPFGETPDCDGICYPLYFIGDGNCDDGSSFQSNFDCATFNFDEGDCATDSGTPSFDTGPGCGLTFTLSTGSWAGEVGWSILDAQGNVVYDSPSGTYPDNNRDYVHGITLSPGSYTVAMSDSFGDGWNGGSFALTDTDGDVLADGALASGSYAEVDFDVTADDCLVDTGPEPVDTAPPADCGDVLFNLTTVSWGNEISWTLVDEDGTVWADGSGYASNGTYDQFLSLPTGIYTVQMNDSFGDGWNGGTFTVTDLSTGDTLGSDGLSTGSYGESTFIVDCSDTWDPVGTGGGTDPVPSDVTCDPIVVDLSTGSWAGEVGWEIYDALTGELVASGGPNEYSNNTDYEIVTDLTGGVYEVVLTDTFGDGWNGATIAIVDQTSGYEFAFESGFTSGSEFTFDLTIDCPIEPPDVFDHTGGCADDAIEDCDGVCWPASYLGDGFCDDGTTFAANFDCPSYSSDNGDCP